MGATAGKFLRDKEIGMSCRKVVGTVPLCLIAFAACGGSAGRASTVRIDTLANGAVVVHNPARGLWDSASAWRIVPDLAIGRAEGSGPDTFGQVGAIAVDRAGRIYVLDSQAQEIRVFESAGSYVRTIGRKGGGPGEFQGAVGMAFDPVGRLWVVDGRANRLTVFDSAGAVVATHARPGFGPFGGWIGGFTRDGMLYDETTIMSEEVSADGVHRVGHSVRSIVVYDTSGTARDTFALPSYTSKSFPPISIKNGSSRVTMGFGVPFSPELRVAFDPAGLIWAGVGDAYAIYAIDMKGDTTRGIGRAYTPVPVTAAEREAALERIRKFFKGAGVSLDASLVPDHRSAFREIIADGMGDLWIATPVPAGGTADPLDVFRSDGRYLGVVHLPFSTEVRTLTFHGSRAYWVKHDSLGVAYVVRGRVVGREARD
jgi:6-bladed beta-propeller